MTQFTARCEPQPWQLGSPSYLAIQSTASPARGTHGSASVSPSLSLLVGFSHATYIYNKMPHPHMNNKMCPFVFLSLV
jgi:hypothetical protein